MEDQVVGDDISRDTSLIDETVELQKRRVLPLPELRGQDGVHGEDRRAAIGVDGVASVESGFLQIVLSDQFEDVIVEIEAFPSEGRYRFRQLGDVWVLDRPRDLRLLLLLMRSVEGVERRLHAKTALALATFRGGFFLRRERHVTDGGKRRR